MNEAGEKSIPKMPEEVKKEWENRAGAVVLSTVDLDGSPNSIYATCAGLYEDSKIPIVDNCFDKIIKIFSQATWNIMKSWNPDEHPGHGAAAV